MKKKHLFESVIRSLSKKNDLRIKNNEILILRDKVYNKKTMGLDWNPKKKWDLGNKSWGKISFLVNHCGFTQYFVSEF